MKRTQLTFTEVQLKLLAQGIRYQMNNLGNGDVQEKHNLARTLTRLLNAIKKFDLEYEK